MKGIYFITGIDTEIGKTVATGMLAKQLQDSGKKVITQKLVQTGNDGYSEDLEIHRKWQGKHFPEDAEGLTATSIFHHPASPHLAARLDNKPLQLDVITQASDTLASRYEVVLLEGAGGLMVPLTDELLTIDYIARLQYPVVLVTSSRLGSINHTLLSLMALKQYHLKLHTLLYNGYHDDGDPLIAADTRHYLKQQLAQQFPEARWQEMPVFA